MKFRMKAFLPLSLIVQILTFSTNTQANWLHSLDQIGRKWNLTHPQRKIEGEWRKRGLSTRLYSSVSDLYTFQKTNRIGQPIREAYFIYGYSEPYQHSEKLGEFLWQGMHNHPEAVFVFVEAEGALKAFQAEYAKRAARTVNCRIAVVGFGIPRERLSDGYHLVDAVVDLPGYSGEPFKLFQPMIESANRRMKSKGLVFEGGESLFHGLISFPLLANMSLVEGAWPIRLELVQGAISTSGEANRVRAVTDYEALARLFPDFQAVVGNVPGRVSMGVHWRADEEGIEPIVQFTSGGYRAIPDDEKGRSTEDPFWLASTRLAQAREGVIQLTPEESARAAVLSEMLEDVGRFLNYAAKKVYFDDQNSFESVGNAIRVSDAFQEWNERMTREIEAARAEKRLGELPERFEYKR